MSLHRQLGAFNPDYGYHFVPGLKARVEHHGGGYLVKVNEAGFRSNNEFVAEKPPGTFRALLFGDSFTAGDGVSNGARYSEVLEELVPGLQVYNFGVPGTGPDEHLLIYRNAARGIDHDLVIIGVWVENIRRVMMRYRPGLKSTTGELLWMPKAYFTLGPDGELVRGNDPVPRDQVPTEELDEEDRAGMMKVTGLRATRHIPQSVRKVIQRTTKYDTLPEYQSPDSPGWRLLSAILRTWTAESSVPVIVMPIPTSRHLDETTSAEHYQARYAELADPPRVTISDPLPKLLEYPVEERLTFRFSQDDDHPTKRYHRVLAELLAPAVTEVREATAQHA